MLGQAHFDLAEGPILVAHQARQRQQLRLREHMLRELTPIGRHDGLRHEPTADGKFHQALRPSQRLSPPPPTCSSKQES